MWSRRDDDPTGDRGGLDEFPQGPKLDDASGFLLVNLPIRELTKRIQEGAISIVNSSSHIFLPNKDMIHV